MLSGIRRLFVSARQDRAIARARRAIACGDFPAAEGILSAIRKFSPDHPGLRREHAMARLLQCRVDSDLAQALQRLSRRLYGEAPTVEVERLLEGGLRLADTGETAALSQKQLAFLLGPALLSMNENGADACSQACRGGEVAGSAYAEFDLRTPLLEYCQKFGHPWRTFDDLRLSPVRRDGNPAVQGVASFLCKLPEGMVLGTSFIPAAPSGHAFPEQCVHNARKLRWEDAPELLDMARLASVSRLLVSSAGTDHYSGPHLLIGNCENFAHWLLNHLPRLRLAEDMPELENISVVVGEDIRPSHRDCLIRAGIAPERLVYLRQGRIASFGELWVPSMLFCGLDAERGEGRGLHWNSSLLSFLRRRLRLDFSAAPKRRVFISRRNARWRRLQNEEEVVSALQRFGFELVDPGTLTLAEQLALAADSQIIVGPLGAGLYFFLFAPPGTPVVELKYDTNDVMDFNWSLHQALGQPHHLVIGESLPTHPDILKRDFTVAADRVAEVVERALDSTAFR
jgi:hypothetical protein